MRIFLAPMEGVVDFSVRALLSGIGGIDGCVTEFVRVTHTQLPEKVFQRFMPELNNNCRTQNGTDVKLQLLGGNPESLAINAQRAVNYGARAIDLNFGCPAKTVNNSDGGASLLRCPERVYNIVRAVRCAVPSDIPVSAKIRLGFEDRSSYMDNANAVAEAGAAELCVHARSKADGYKPPAYWDYINRIREAVDIPVVANGEIWNLEDFKRCREQSGCEDFMLGRGLMAHPDLARQIKAHIAGEEYQCLSWREICTMLHNFHRGTVDHYPKKYMGNRLKQWLMYLRRHYPEADVFFEAVKRQRDAESIERIFDEQYAVIS
jgi:tRNA-dihydrouridine synthase C